MKEFMHKFRLSSIPTFKLSTGTYAALEEMKSALRSLEHEILFTNNDWSMFKREKLSVSSFKCRSFCKKNPKGNQNRDRQFRNIRLSGREIGEKPKDNGLIVRKSDVSLLKGPWLLQSNRNGRKIQTSYCGGTSKSGSIETKQSKK